MSLLTLVLKQMRQRALSTWLTLLSVLLGVALAVSILLFRREAGNLFGQNDYGYDVLVGPKGSPTQLVLNTVYHLDKSPGNIPYSIYEQLANPRNPDVKIAVPYAVGDSYKGERIVGTLPKLFGYADDGQPLRPDKVMEYRPREKYAIADGGRVFAADKFEAVIGSEIGARTGLKVGDQFQATHGLPLPNETPDVHKPKWTVVGVLKPTRTANDRVLFIPLLTIYCITEHEDALAAQEALREGKDPNQAVKELHQQLLARAATQPDAAEDHDEDADDSAIYTLRPDGTIDLKIPKAVWSLSAVLVKARGGPNVMQLMYAIRNGPVADAVNPAGVMRDFFGVFLKGPTLLLLIVAGLVTVVAGVGILVSIYNSVSARMREIAILRALGATRARILALICTEAGVVGLAGGALGLLAGHLLGAVGSAFMQRWVGRGIDWVHPDRYELLYLAAVVVLSVLAGLVPALKAYRSPVATNLVAG